MDTIVATALLLGIAIGAAVSWWLKGRSTKVEFANLADAAKQRDTLAKECSDFRENLARAQGKLELAETELQELQSARKQIFDLARENACLHTKLEADADAHNKQVAQLTSIKEETENKFKLIANEALKNNLEEFSKRADKNIADLVKPLGDSLQTYEAHIKEIEKARNESYGELKGVVESVRAQQTEVKDVTANLVSALRASPKVPGRWGEETLKRVVELCGMTEHCDFEREKVFRDDDENLRPDMLIHVPGGRSIVVDSKAPVSAYLEAVNATTEDDRNACLQRHAVQLRQRMQSLSNKSYWQRFDGSTDCVVMFVPGDNFISAAFQRDPTLFDDAIENRVLICTPTTFIALAKAISYGWRQERIQTNVLEVGRLAKDLYLRLRDMGDHVSELGTHLKNATKKYNQFVGSLESRVMPQARRFNDLGVEGTTEPLSEIKSVDTVVNFPKHDRDLLLTRREGES